MHTNGSFIQRHSATEKNARAELVQGLMAAQAQVAPKYFYDALGSRLFEAICELPEYYPTRTEAAILTTYLSEIAAVAGKDVTLIDLGAGNCAKAARLFDALQPRQYVPVDISVDFLREAVLNLQQRHPHIAMLGLGLDFSAQLDLPDAVQAQRRLFFYPGSSIGNFSRPDALAFLRRLRAEASDDGGLLIGADLQKDASVIRSAYDDALGVTAAFNLNLLQHLNRLLEANFCLADWRHHAEYDADEGCIKMFLIARRANEVSWCGGGRAFAPDEAIHTESSCKYTQDSFFALLEEAGFHRPRAWQDLRGWFMVCHAHAA